jgi:hypothetical protein
MWDGSKESESDLPARLAAVRPVAPAAAFRKMDQEINNEAI